MMPENAGVVPGDASVPDDRGKPGHDGRGGGEWMRRVAVSVFAGGDAG